MASPFFVRPAWGHLAVLVRGRAKRISIPENYSFNIYWTITASVPKSVPGCCFNAGIAFPMQLYCLCESNLEFIRVRALDMLSVDSYITHEIAEINDENGWFEGFLWKITLLKSLRKAPS